MIAHTHSFSFKGRAPIALELDSEAGAVYLRFSNAQVKKTVDIARQTGVFTVDLDKSGEVIGVEMACFTKAQISINNVEKAIFNTLKERFDLSSIGIRSPQLATA